MSTNGQFNWVDFYKELSEKLLAYKGNRQELISKVKQIFSETGINLPTLERDNQIVDIDPFTVFGLFNKSSMKEANRVRIITAIKAIFDVSAPVPQSFSSIPVLNNQNATFYYFVGDREEGDIDDLWGLFESALEYAVSPTTEKRDVLSKYFDLAINKKGNGNSKITMGLYWIAPDAFLNLDQRNTWYIYESGKMPSSLVETLPVIETNKIAAATYFAIVEKLRDYLQGSNSEFKDFIELSAEAWRYSEYVNQQNKAAAADSEKANSKASIIKWFKPVIDALRDLGGSGTPEQVRNWIIENEHLDDEVINETRGATQQNKFSNEVAWARNYLVYGGYIDKSVRGVWTLTEKGESVEMTHELASQIFFDGVKKNADHRKSQENTLADDESQTTHYWLYSPGDGAGIWNECYESGIMAIGWDKVGDLRQYKSKAEMKLAMKEHIDPDRPYTMAAHATWQFVHEMKPGDIIFAKKGMHAVIGRGVVESEYEFDDTREEYKNVRKVKWTHNGEWQHPGQAAMKTLTDITSYTDYVEKLNALFESDEVDDVESEEVQYPPYSKEEFLEEVYMDEVSYDTLVGLIINKKNVILQGAPGVGKTYAAKRLAYSIMEEKDPNRVMMVQFHQSYSYEDFIMGFRPSEKGFELKRGAFYSFCKDAEIDSENEYFFIIDEINRGNLSKIFGELFMLIENDKRGVELQLLYSDEKFSVPDNVYIIGMMNTADRSLAMLDYALRRRFAFYEMKPGFSTDGFREYRIGLNNAKFDNLIQCVEQLNIAIAGDESLGEGFCIGHSYFCNLKEVNDQALSGIVEYELIPLLKEYWFDEPVKVKNWADSLRNSIK